MGSFNGTCIVSGLPIECGTPIRFLALTQSRYHKGAQWACYVNGRWQVRCPPLKGEYNDYGSITNMEMGLVSEVFFGSFGVDAIEKGIGDNPYHDVKVRKNMSPQEWLSALWEGRVEVNDDLAEGVDPMQYVPPAEVPTLDRVEALLRAADLPVASCWQEKGYIVDEPVPGRVRVRWGNYEEKTERLSVALGALGQKYAARLSDGPSVHMNEKEILVMARPDVAYTRPKPAPAREVAQGMIREDVWQALLKPIETWDGRTVTLDNMIVEAKRYMAHLETRVLHGSLSMSFRPTRDNLFSDILRGAEGVSGFFYPHALDLAIKLTPSPEELESFVRALCEMAMVEWNYSKLNGQWNLSTNFSQDTDWEALRKFHRVLSEIRGRYEEDGV